MALDALGARITGTANLTTNDTNAPAASKTPATDDVEKRIAEKLSQMKADGSSFDYVYAAEKIRNPAYQNKISQILQNPEVVKVIDAMTAEMSDGDHLFTMYETLWSSPVKEDASDLPSKQAALRSVKAIAKEMGFSGDVRLYLPNWGNDLMGINGYVWTSAQNNPEVALTSALVNTFWDAKGGDEGKGGWRVAYQGTDGSLSTDPTKGEKVEAGRLAFESIVRHELGHIKDKVALYDEILWMLFMEKGIDLLAADGFPAVAAKSPKFAEKLSLLSQSLKARMPEGKRNDVADFTSKRWQSDYAKLKGHPSVQQMLKQVSQMAGLQFHEDFSYPDGFDQFIENWLVFHRGAESTADNYAVATQGTSRFNNLVESIFDGNGSAGTNGELLDWAHLIGSDPTKKANEKLETLMKLDAEHPIALDLNDAQFTHPHSFVRILQANDYIAQPENFGHKAVAYEALPPAQKLPATLQLVNSELNEAQVQARGNNIVASMDPVLTLFAKKKAEKTAAVHSARLDELAKLELELLGDLSAKENPRFDELVAALEASPAITDAKLPDDFLAQLKGQLEAKLEGASGDAKTALEARLTKVGELLTQALEQEKAELGAVIPRGNAVNPNAAEPLFAVPGKPGKP